MEDLSFDDIMAIFKRRRFEFFITFGLIFVLAIAFTLHWSRYRAVTTVQIIQPYISSNVANVGKQAEDSIDPAGLADRRISQIEQKVTSDASLYKIATDLKLYPGLTEKVKPNILANVMRSKIHLQFVSSEIANPAAVAKESVEQLSAIAFTLSFDYGDPENAKKTLDAIVAAFINEEAAQRHQQAAETSDFLDGQLKTLDVTIQDTEKKIADFRGKYGESGPSAVMFNQQASLTNSMSLETIRGQMTANESNISSLRSQLIGVNPYMSVNDSDRTIRTNTATLPALEAEYAQLKTRYGDQHPDVMKVKAQIDALKASGATGSKPVVGADNPVYVQVNTQLAAAESQRASLQSQYAALMGQQAKFSTNIAKNPAIEQQMNQLTLDLENQKDRYHTLKDKQLASEIQEKLESGSNRELLKVINPTTVPEQTAPPRKMLLGIGFLLAIFGAAFVVGARELMSQSIRGVHHLAAIVGVAPLVAVPHIEVTRHG